MQYQLNQNQMNGVGVNLNHLVSQGVLDRAYWMGWDARGEEKWESKHN